MIKQKRWHIRHPKRKASPGDRWLALWRSALAATAAIVYVCDMALLLRQIIQSVVTKVASDPALREKATDVARDLVLEGKQISQGQDRAYAAGKALKRMVKKYTEDDKAT